MHATLIASQVMIGLIGLAARQADQSPEWLTVLRCGFAVMALLMIVLATRSWPSWGVLKARLVPLIATGVFMGLNWLFFFRAILTMDLSEAIIIYNATPLFVAVGGLVLLRERLATAQLVVVSIVAVAVLPVVYGSWAEGDGVAAVSALVAAAFFAQVGVLGRYLRELPSTTVVAFQVGVGGLVVLPLAVASSTGLVMTLESFGWAFLIGIGVTAVPYLMYFRSLQTVTAFAASMAHGVYTLTTFLVGWWVYGEAVGFGLVLALTAIVLAPGIVPVVGRWRRGFAGRRWSD